MLDTIHSPFRYAGGKFYARKLIQSHIPPHKVYIEPFAGGASIFFSKKKESYNQLNDIDPDLINVYRVIRDQPYDLIQFLTKVNIRIRRLPEQLLKNIKTGDPLPADRELYQFFKTEYKPKTTLERAGRWFYLNRTTFSGITNAQNMYWGYGDKFSMQPKNWPRHILSVSEKLQGVVLSNHDFEEVLENAPDQAFLFIDPPYFNADQDKFYNYPFSKNDHYRLSGCLFKNKDRLQLFITYDNSPEIRAMYNWALEIHDKEWNYCIQRTDDQKNGSGKKGERYKGKELFILNYSSENLENKKSDQVLVVV